MHGGYSNGETPLGDVWYLDLSAFFAPAADVPSQPRWRCVRAADDSPRFWHTSTLLQTETNGAPTEAVIVYGGMAVSEVMIT